MLTCEICGKEVQIERFQNYFSLNLSDDVVHYFCSYVCMHEWDNRRKNNMASTHMSDVNSYEIKDSKNNKIILNRCNTSIKEKKENFDKFVELIKNQFWHGGEKYKLSEDKEFTDGICEMFPGETGVDWVLGTVLKYLGRYKNFGREKDLLKIATYCYILWLKGGFHKSSLHDEDIKKG